MADLTDETPPVRRRQPCTESRQGEGSAPSSERLLRAISRLQSLFIDDAEPDVVVGAMLHEIVMLTGSDSGCIGTVLHHADPRPYWRTDAVTDSAWTEETKVPNQDCNYLKALCEQAMSIGRRVMANDPRACGILPGRMSVGACVALPIYRGKQLIGVVGVANRPGGYDDAGIAHLDPFLSTCAQLLEGFWNRRLRTEAEAALRDSEDRFRAAAQGANEGIWDWNLKTNEAYFSPRWKTILGYEDHEVANNYQEWESRLHPHDRDRVLAYLNDYLAGKVERYDLEFRLLKKSGDYCWIHARGSLLHDADGRRTRLAGSHEDITERKQEEALQAAEKQALESVARGNALTDVLESLCQAVETHTAPMLCSIMLVTDEGTHLSSIAGPSLPEAYRRAIRRVPIGPTVGSCGSAAYFRQPAVTADIATDPLWKDYASVALSHGLKACWSLPIVGAHDTVLGTLAVYHHEPRAPRPTELKILGRVSQVAAVAIEHAKVTDALRDSEARFEAFMRHNPAVTFIKDAAGHYVYGNPQFERLSSLSRQEISGKTVFDFLPEEIATCLSRNDTAVLASGEKLESEVSLPTPAGTIQHWLVIKFPLDTVRRELLGGIAIEITARKHMEAQLAAQNECWALFIEHSPVALAMLDREMRYLAVSRRWMLDYRLGDESIIGRSHYDVFPEIPERWRVIHRRCLAGAVERSEEDPFVRTDGRIDWSRWEIRPWRIGDGTVGGIVIFSEDITPRRQIQDDLRRTQFAMDQAVDAVYWIDPQARILYTNDAAGAMLGYCKEEFLRMTVHDLNPSFPPEVWPGWWEEVREKQVVSLETNHLTHDGRLIPVEIRVNFLAYGGQEFHCVFVRDISERKRRENALGESQKRFELAVRATNDGIWDWNIQTGEQYWSDHHFELFGLDPGAFVPTYDTWISLIHPDDAGLVHRATRHHLDTREPYDVEARVRMKDGSYRWFRDRGQAVWDGRGRPVRMVGSTADVTERRKAEELIWKAHAELEQRVKERTIELATANRCLQEEIAERQRVEHRLERTQYAVDHAADQIFVIDSKGYILDVNESACRRLGYTKEELLTMSVMDVDSDCSQELWIQVWAEFTEKKGMRLDRQHRSKTGEIYPVEVQANYLLHQGQELSYAIVRDVTERRQAEQAIRESDLRYKLLTEATFDGVAIHDHGVLLEVNPGLERMFGYEPGELVGRSIMDLIAEESRDHVAANMQDGVSGPYEAVARRKDGSGFPGEVVVRPYRYRGKEVRLVAGRDITVRKQLEAEKARYLEELERQVVERTADIAKLESQRAQTEKLAAVGQMAAAVAHEINNPIAGIRNAFTLIKQAVDQTHPHYEFVGMIDREISRVAAIVQNMYQLYRKEPSRSEPVQLERMLRDLDAVFAKQLSQRRLACVSTLSCPTPTLNVPQSDLLQVLMNLIQNAIDSSPQGGTVRLNVEQHEDIVTIRVSDEGSGIAPDVLPHIFDPFFTTKTEKGQKGMGLGLSVSQSMVMAMGGRIEVRTKVTCGSTFSVVLPKTPTADRTLVKRNIIKEVLSHDG